MNVPMKRKFAGSALIALLAALCASAQSAPSPSAALDDAWGDSVDGVQLHLELSKNPSLQHAQPQPLDGELPVLEIRMLNTNNTPVSYGNLAAGCDIEIDGVWYAQGPSRKPLDQKNDGLIPPSAPFRYRLDGKPGNELASALQSHGISIRVETFSVNGKTVAWKELNLRPGMHALRVRTARTDPALAIENSAHEIITLVSNAIAVNIAAPIVAESDALVWGDSVNGIQLRLVQSKTQVTPSVPGGLASLEMQIRNVGPETATFNVCGCGLLPQIEIDGDWYSPLMITVTGTSAPSVMPPRTQSENIGLECWNAHGFAVDGKSMLPNTGKIVGLSDLNVSSGKHSVRVKVSADVKGPDIQGSTTIALISNAITVDFP
jgi:hypothetical protein